MQISPDPGDGSTLRFSLPEHDLFPESIAYDSESRDYFLGSMSHSRILRIHQDGSYEDFLQSPLPELESSIGMKADSERRVLWVCTGRFTLFAEPSPRPARTGLLKLDLDDGRLLASWTVSQESPYHICNDLELAPDGSVFATTTLIGRTVHVSRDLDRISEVHRLPEGSHNNGITLDPVSSHLFVAVDRGIRRYDLAGDEWIDLPIPEGAGFGPDGLYYHGGSLVMVQPRSSRITRLFLDDAHEAITSFEVLAENHEDFAYPTTGVLVGDTLVFVATSYADRGRRADTSRQHEDVLIHAIATPLDEPRPERDR